jgi:hypothetical protein
MESITYEINQLKKIGAFLCHLNVILFHLLVTKVFKVPEGTRLPRILIILRWILMPFDTLRCRIGWMPSYIRDNPMMDTVTIYGQKYTGALLRQFGKGYTDSSLDNNFFQFKRINDIVTIEKLETSKLKINEGDVILLRGKELNLRDLDRLRKILKGFLHNVTVIAVDHATQLETLDETKMNRRGWIRQESTDEIYKSGAADERKVIWNEINNLIKSGNLQGNGFDEMAQRNGLILACNTILKV